MNVDRRWLAVGCAVVALAIGLIVPRPGFAPTHAQPESTVPPQLSKPDPALAALPDVSPTASALTVDVCGAVHRPGVFTFPSGSRVVDALKQAGGATSEADVDQVNLAQPLADAMKICVPHKGQTILTDVAQTGVAYTSYRPLARHHVRSHGRSAHKLALGQTLNVNTATAEELTQLPGVGPGLAQRIVDFRQQNGFFQTIEDLQNVPGLGPSKFDRLSPFVRL